MLMERNTKIVASLHDWVKSMYPLYYDDNFSYLPPISSIEELIEVRWNSKTQSWEEIIYNIKEIS